MKAVIPAAGFGTRMLPVTKVIPKEMMPVANKPVIQYAVEWLVGAWIQDIVMITSQWKFAISEYFDKHYELEQLLEKKGKVDMLQKVNATKWMANICYVSQHEQLGFAHAVLHAEPWVDSDYFVMVAADTIFHPETFKEIIQKHKDTWKTVVWVFQIPLEETYKYGVVEIEDWKISSMIEKPPVGTSTADHIQVGIYVLPKTIFSIIRQLAEEHDWSFAEISPPDAMLELMKNDDILPYVLNHKFWDAGSPEGWLQACNELANWFN